MISLDEKREFVGDADNTLYLQQSAGLREIFDRARDPACTVEFNRSNLERAPALAAAMVVHGTGPFAILGSNPTISCLHYTSLK
jgi:hypothetical protein